MSNLSSHEQSIGLRAALSRHNLVAFSEQLGRATEGWYPNARFHEEIYQALENDSIKRLLVIMPPAHGKSTAVTIYYPLWKIGHKPNLRFIIASHTKDFVTTFPRAIMGWMQSSIYQGIFGELKPEHPTKWTQSQLVVNRTSMEKDPTVRAIGTEQATIGPRADEIICDDIIDETIASSQTLRESVKTWFRKELLTRLEPNGRLILVGTRWHFLDLYSDLMKEQDEQGKPVYLQLIFPALNEENEALWSSKWPLERLLERKRALGSVDFSAQYLCDPTPREGALLKREWLNYWSDEGEDKAKRVYRLPPRDKLRVYQAWDLAISEQPTADWTVCVTLGVDMEGGIYVLDIYHEHIDFPAQVKQVEALAAVWNPERIAIESNAYQKALPQALRSGHLPVVEVKQTKDKIMRIQELAPHFENGSIRISHAHDDFLLEYLQFPKGEHDDILDALHLAFNHIKTPSAYGPGSRPIVRVLDW